MRLYSTKEVAEIINVSTDTVRDIATKLNIKHHKIQGSKGHYFDQDQLYQIKAKRFENYRVRIIHHTQTFWIIESKMNYENNR